jgi:hypothetical protein
LPLRIEVSNYRWAKNYRKNLDNIVISQHEGSKFDLGIILGILNLVDWFQK